MCHTDQSGPTLFPMPTPPISLPSTPSGWIHATENERWPQSLYCSFISEGSQLPYAGTQTVSSDFLMKGYSSKDVLVLLEMEIATLQLPHPVLEPSCSGPVAMEEIQGSWNSHVWVHVQVLSWGNPHWGPRYVSEVVLDPPSSPQPDGDHQVTSIRSRRNWGHIKSPLPKFLTCGKLAHIIKWL